MLLSFYHDHGDDDYDDDADVCPLNMMMTITCFANHLGYGPLPKFNSTSVTWIPQGWLVER